jgi:hypothetical protein
MGVSYRSAALAVVVTAGVATGFVEKGRELSRARGAPMASIPDEIRVGAREIASVWPPGAAGAFVSDDVEWAACGAWQRALHPRAVVCCRTPVPSTLEEFRVLRSDGRVRWAFGRGTPPDHLDLGPAVRRLPSGLWFVDLRESR